MPIRAPGTRPGERPNLRTKSFADVVGGIGSALRDASPYRSNRTTVSRPGESAGGGAVYGSSGPTGASRSSRPVFTGAADVLTGLASRSSGGGSSTTSGGGAGGGARVSSGGTGHLQSALAEIRRAREAAERQRRQLDSEYNSSVDELRDEYQFAETEEEKAQIAFLLEDLEAQRTAADQAIGAGYQQAIDSVEGRQVEMEAATEAEAGVAGDLFRGAADRLRGDVADVSSEAAEGGSGLGVGLDGGSAAADEFIGLMEAAAPREEALARRLGGIAEDDMAWLASTMEGEREAQRGDLQRQATANRANMQALHQSQVADRIQREREQFRSQLNNMQMAFQDRGWRLDDQANQTYQQAADMRFQAGESAAQRRMQASQANARMQQERERMRLSQQQAEEQELLTPAQQRFLMSADSQGLIGTPMAAPYLQRAGLPVIPRRAR